MRKDLMKQLLVKLGERERAIDMVHEAADRLALSSISDEDLRVLAEGAGTEEEQQRFEETRARYAACKTAAEAQDVYLSFYPGRQIFDYQTLRDFEMIGLSARMRSPRLEEPRI